jgi:hypothetical protein
LERWAGGGYIHFIYRQYVTLQVLCGAGSKSETKPATGGTGETTSALMAPISADGDDVVSLRFALHAECGDTSEDQTAVGIFIRDTR